MQKKLLFSAVDLLSESVLPEVDQVLLFHSDAGR